MMYTKTRAIGIDVGTAIVGWAVVDKQANKLQLVAADAILTKAKTPMSDRLLQISEQLNEIIQKYHPSEMAVEDIFFFNNQKTVISVSQARGVILLAGASNGMSVADYTPLQVKQAVTSYGRADKDQVKAMVGKILRIAEMPKLDDINDAMAVAICHLNTLH